LSSPDSGVEIELADVADDQRPTPASRAMRRRRLRRVKGLVAPAAMARCMITHWALRAKSTNFGIVPF